MAKRNNNMGMLWLALGLFVAVALAGVFLVYPAVRKMTYPLKYQSTIVEYAAKYGLDPYLVCGVIHTESKFDAEAESSVGAVGLMQVMPATGQWIAQKMDLENFSTDQLTDPKVNIQMGCWYLRYLFDKFGDDLTLVLAGYNAGPTKVAQWLAQEQHSQDGKLTNIPYQETANYVERVQNAQSVYKQLYTLPQ